MYNFCCLFHVIVHVLVISHNPINTSNNLQWFNNTEEHFEMTRNTSDVEVLNTTEETFTMPSSSKIIGGRRSSPTEFPPIAALLTKRYNTESVCTGTVLNDRFVLTAGHCITKAIRITIYIDCVELYRCKEKRLGSAILHPRYGTAGKTIVNDIGLVRSSRPFSTTVYAYLSTVTTYYQGCVVMGYGFTSENLRKFNSKLYKLEVLQVIPCTYFFPPIAANPTISTMICSLTDGSRRISFGDSGGPLICNKTQVGVTSQLIRRSGPNGKKLTVMSWVPVSLFSEWIVATMSSSSRPSFTIQLPVFTVFLICFTLSSSTLS